MGGVRGGGLAARERDFCKKNKKGLQCDRRKERRGKCYFRLPTLPPPPSKVILFRIFISVYLKICFTTLYSILFFFLL